MLLFYFQFQMSFYVFFPLAIFYTCNKTDFFKTRDYLKWYKVRNDVLFIIDILKGDSGRIFSLSLLIIGGDARGNIHLF